MRALVVGGAGFIGSFLVERLLAEHAVVDVVDNLSTGSLANLSDARNDGLGELRFHHLDARDPAFIELVEQRKPEVIFVLADPGAADPRAPEALVSMCLNVSEAAQRSGVAKIVMTLDAMALHGKLAAVEVPVKDSRAFAPDTPRGVGMRAVVDLLTLARKQAGVEFTGVALTHVYGPRQLADRGPVASFFAAHRDGRPAEVTGDGRQTRDLLYVDDAVDAIARASAKGGGLVINVGTGIQTPIRVLERLVMTEIGPPPTKAAAVDTEATRFAVSPVRARIQLAWAPWTSLADGIESMR